MSTQSQSPAPHDAGSPAPQEGDGSESDIPKRMMRVKVLYTFDDDNKTNCLARLPNSLPIPVVALDEAEIGIMELKICIQAIVASSPELIAKLEHDYTVYAYDYSEYETPLVGQGMLSWVLASASPTPSAPASQSQTMITGRVCKNILGLFSSNGIKETLEVKLKLVPVPTRSKNEFLQNMAMYRNPSVVMPDGFDNNAWDSFLQAIPVPNMMDDSQMNMGSSISGRGQSARAGTGGVEQLHDMLTPKFEPDDDIFSMGHFNSRGGSPALSHHSYSAQQPVFDGSRPNSRLSMHGQQQQQQPQQQQQQQNSFLVDDQGFEEGPAPKRARLQQADWNGRGSFGSTADSLRVAVSTSASIRGFRPGSIAGNSSASNDMIPRAPTPQPGEKRGGRPLVQTRASNLRRASSASYTNTHQMDPNTMRADSGIYSHDDDAQSSHFSSPSPNLPSSPPEYTPIEDAFPPSSPGLPELPLPTDSGFQSDYYNDAEQPNLRAPRFANNRRAHSKGQIQFMPLETGPNGEKPVIQTTSRVDEVSQRRAANSVGRRSIDPNLPPSSPTPRPAQPHIGRSQLQRNHTAPTSRNPSSTPFQLDAPSPNNPIESIEAQTDSNPLADSTSVMQPPAVPTNASEAPAPPGGPQDQHDNARTSSINLPPRNPHSQQGQGPQQGVKRTMARAQTWTAGADSSDVESDGPVGNSRFTAGPERIRAPDPKLVEAVQTGAPVKYCLNCGEIKTCTWRPYWVRTCDGDGAEYYNKKTIGVHLVEPLIRDHNGVTTRYRIYKQFSRLTPEEKSANVYQQFNFCNPCGDYIRKWAVHRPQERWDPSFKPVKKKEKTGKRQPNPFTSDAVVPSSDFDGPPSAATNAPRRFSTMPDYTDPFLPSEGPMAPTPHASRPPTSGANQAPQQVPSLGQQQLAQPAVAMQGGGDAWDADELEMALEKAIASSPARNLGSATSPIEIPEESPNPTRRLLFPSPRKDGEFKSLADPPEVGKSGSQPLQKQRFQCNATNSTPVAKKSPPKPMVDIEVDKENLPPIEEDEEDDFAHLFDDTLLSGTPIPVTPRTEKRIQKMFKTPRPVKVRTPRTGNGNGSKRSRTSHLLETPTRSSGGIRKSPRFSGRGASGGRLTNFEQQQLTPISASLNQLLNEAIRSSPGKNFGWSPGKLFGGDLGNMNFNNSNGEYPLPSSPPIFHSGDFGTGMDGGQFGVGDAGGANDFGGVLDLPGFEMWEDSSATDPVKGWEEFLASDAVASGEQATAIATAMTGEEEKSVTIDTMMQNGEEKAGEVGSELTLEETVVEQVVKEVVAEVETTTATAVTA